MQKKLPQVKKSKKNTILQGIPESNKANLKITVDKKHLPHNNSDVSITAHKKKQGREQRMLRLIT